MHDGDDPGRPAPGEPKDSAAALDDGLPLADAGPVPPARRATGSPGAAQRALAQRRARPGSIPPRAWSGPLPPPDILGEYERQLPGAAERILTFAMRLTTAMISISAVFFSLAVARVGNTSAAMAGGSVFLSVPVIMLFRAFITRR